MIEYVSYLKRQPACPHTTGPSLYYPREDIHGISHASAAPLSHNKVTTFLRRFTLPFHLCVTKMWQLVVPTMILTSPHVTSHLPPTIILHHQAIYSMSNESTSSLHHNTTQPRPISCVPYPSAHLPSPNTSSSKLLLSTYNHFVTSNSFHCHKKGLEPTLDILNYYTFPLDRPRYN